MKTIKGELNDHIFDELIRLDKTSGMSKISEGERNIIKAQERFEAIYYSNKFEGNKLSKDEARKAILIE